VWSVGGRCEGDVKSGRRSARAIVSADYADYADGRPLVRQRPGGVQRPAMVGAAL